MGVSSAMLAVLLLFSLPGLWAKGPAANRKGNEAFRKGNYEAAGQAYAKAGEALPGERAIAYNQGTALLRAKKYDDALKSLMAGAGDPRRAVKEASLYNAGNALAESQKLQEALSAYRQAILADPSDRDAKFNYELTKRKLQQGQDQNKNDKNKDDKNKDQQKNQQNQQGQDNKDQQQQDQQNQDKQDQQQQNSQENQDKAQQNPDQPQPEQGDEQQGSEDQKPQPAARLTKEQAERLLDALKDNEVEMIKARLKSKRKKSVEKDW